MVKAALAFWYISDFITPPLWGSLQYLTIFQIVEDLNVENLVNAAKCPTRVELSVATENKGMKEGFKWIVKTIIGSMPGKRESNRHEWHILLIWVAHYWQEVIHNISLVWFQSWALEYRLTSNGKGNLKRRDGRNWERDLKRREKEKNKVKVA